MFLRKWLDKNILLKNQQKKFKELWSEVLFNEVGSRDFFVPYNYMSKHESIKEWAIKSYFNFVSEDSPRFKDACDTFDSHYVMRAFLSLLDYDSIPLFETQIKKLVEKKASFLSEKCTESAVLRHSVNYYIQDVLNNYSSEGESFIKEALDRMKNYEKLKENGKFKSACSIALLSDAPEDYPSNIKKYLYYAACRPVTDENIQQTKDYFEYVKKYYSFSQTLDNGETVSVTNIDVVICEIAHLNNGGDIDAKRLENDIVATIKGYCREHLYTPVFLLLDYLYLIGEASLEMLTLETLFQNAGFVNEKYRKRYSFLKLVYKTSNSFVLRNSSILPLECIFLNSSDDIYNVIRGANLEKEKNSWCLCIKQKVDTIELKPSVYFSEKILNSLERVFDNEFGEYAIKGAINTFFDDEFRENALRSILILTSGENKNVHFPKIGVLIRIEPITKCVINVRCIRLYLPGEVNSEDEIIADTDYVQSILNSSDSSVFSSFYKRIEDLVWATIEKLTDKKRP